LIQEPGGWTFRQSPSNLPLYLYAPRLQGTTLCGRRCEAQWVPLLAPGHAKPLGEWSIIERSDGGRQWAFEQHPVYTYALDTPERAAAGPRDNVWHLMPHFPS
jgi:predicted lipoprotein with Yx(FWY)xxD motif